MIWEATTPILRQGDPSVVLNVPGEVEIWVILFALKKDNLTAYKIK